MNRYAFCLVSSLLLLQALLPAPGALAAEADVVYVTDELRLGLYRTEETTGRTLKTLVSGARMEVLERALMSIRIRTEDGDEGWVKTAYIVTNEPARSRVARVEALQTETAAALADRETELVAARADAESARNEMAAAQQGLVELPELKAENESLKAALNQGGVRVPLLWLLIAAFASLLLGVFAGYGWLDRKVRKKFGGVRVY